MAFTNASNPTYYPPEDINPVGPYFIDLDWCIGDSLRYINENNRVFDERTVELSTLFIEISTFSVNLSARDTPTINLDYNVKANILSANVVDSSINLIKLGGDITKPGKALLSSACLSALHDVDLTSITNQQTIVWDEDAGKWVNKDVIGGNFTPGTTSEYGDIKIVISQTGNMTWEVMPLAITNTKIANGTIKYNKLENNTSTTTPIFWWDTNKIGIGTATPATRLYLRSTGTTFTSPVENNTASIVAINTTNNSVNAHATLALQTTTNNGGNPFISYRINGGSYWITGVDNADNDKFKISSSDTSIAASTRLTITTDGKVGIGTTTPDTTTGILLDVNGDVKATTFRGNLQGTATRATNLGGGNAGEISYQTGANNSAFIAAGTEGQVLISNGTASPSWVNASDLSVTDATNAQTAEEVTDGVYLSNNQTITGQKTFSAKIIANGRIQSAINSGSYISAHKGNSGITFNTVGDTGVDSTYFGWLSQRTFSGGYSIGTINDTFHIRWATNANIDNNANNTSELFTINNNGNISFAGSITGGSVPWARLTGIPASLGSTVNLTGNQTVAGIKSFTDDFKPKRIGFVYEDWAETGDGGGTIVNSNQWPDPGYGALMIVGNRSRGGSRVVQVFDVLEVQGAINATGDITAFASDKRLKENITPINNALEKVNSLQGFTYSYNELGQSFNFDGSKKHAGVFAQEIQKVLPEAVDLAPFDALDNGIVKTSKSGENYLTVKYEKIVPLLIEAIKELSKEVEDLKSKIKE